MPLKADRANWADLARPRAVYTILLVAIALLIALIAFSGPLLELVHRWSTQDEYSHGYLIAVIAVWLLWKRRNALIAGLGRPSWTGLALILIAALMHIAGKLSSLFILSQVGFLLVLIGLVLGLGGHSLLKIVFVPIIFLIFAIPLPYFIDATLSWRLQLISSELGVFFIRLFQIPVYLEGNVIDLGVYKLQVVEACSGLRYLYPLMSLGFLAAYLFQAPLWQRALVFLSTIPITIVMNSFRIGVVGVLVNQWGPQDADGWLHFFEGWIIFIACAGILAVEMELLARFGLGKSLYEILGPPNIPSNPSNTENTQQINRAPLPLVGSCLLMCLTGFSAYFVSTRQEILPDRVLFAGFPTHVAGWRGTHSSLEPQVEHFLGLTDYILSDYVKADKRPVNLYVAYYATQRTGLSPHSPSVCIPGNGWQITDFQRTEFRTNEASEPLPLNRVVIARGLNRQLVYYWFEERGTKMANEYLVKLHLLRDAIFANRTDGALIQLTTPIYPGENESDADLRLQDFTKAALPSLAGYLPSGMSSQIKPAMNSSKSNPS